MKSKDGLQFRSIYDFKASTRNDSYYFLINFDVHHFCLYK